MELNLKYRGRIATSEDIKLIDNLMRENPEASRHRLSKLFCQAADWRQANGALRDMVARSYMLELERAGYIKLPAKKSNPPNPMLERKKRKRD